MSYRVELSTDAQSDIHRLHDHILERELTRDGDLTLADEVVTVIEVSLKLLERHPFTCRKAAEADSSFLRELVIPFGQAGYIALFEILSGTRIVVLAVRHQREDDYH